MGERFNGVERTAIPRQRKTSPANRPVLELVKASLSDDKAQGIVVIDLAGKTEIADFMVIASGTSQRQVGAIADHLRERLKASGHRNLSTEGERHCDWVLIDAGDVLVHIFRPEVRAFYNLEKMWGAPLPATGTDPRASLGTPA
jgi:ribosome-associated protein